MHLLHLPSNHYHLLFLPACNSLSGCGQFAVLHFSPLSITYSVLFFSPLCISNQVNLCSRKSQLCLKGLYKVYSIQHSLNNVWWRTHPFLSICEIFFWQLNNVNWLQMLFLGVQTKGKGRRIPKVKEELWFRDIKLIYNTHVYVNVNVDLDQIWIKFQVETKPVQYGTHIFLPTIKTGRAEYTKMQYTKQKDVDLKSKMF